MLDRCKRNVALVPAETVLMMNMADRHEADSVWGTVQHRLCSAHGVAMATDVCLGKQGDSKII